MLKKITSMATAVLLMAGGLSLASAPVASATSVDIDCANYVNNDFIFMVMPVNETRTVTFSGSCIVVGPMFGSALTVTATSDSTQTSATRVSRVSSGAAWSAVIGATPASTGNSDAAIAYVEIPGSMTAMRIQFVTSALFSTATLSDLQLDATLGGSFSSGTDSYTATTSSSGFGFTATATASKVGLNKTKSALVTATCGGASHSLSYGEIFSRYTANPCAISDGQTKIVALTVTALDGVTTKTYEIAVTRTSGGGSSQQQNNNQQGQIVATATISNLTETSADVDFATLAAAHPGVTTWHARLFVVNGGVSTFLNSRDALGSAHTVSLTGLSPGTMYSIFFGDPNHASGVDYGYEPGKRFTTLGGGSSAPSVDPAAVAAAAAQRTAAVVAAKSTLVTTLKAGKPVTAADLSAADIAIASAKAADRVNAKILALPAEKRADLATLQTLVRTENFVDKVSTATTQMRVTSRDLVVEQLIPADYKYKASIIRAIIAENAASLDSIEKVEAVVKAAVAAIQARKDRLAATIAKINGTK